MKVRDIMRRALVTIFPDASMHAAAETMRVREVRHLLVTDGTSRSVNTPSSRSLSVSPEADLERAALLMFERRLGSLPVMEDGRVVGILTEGDVFETLRDEAEPRVLAELFLG